METLKEDWNLAFVVKMIISQRYLLPDVWGVNTFTDWDSCHRDGYYMYVYQKVFKTRKTILVRQGGVPQNTTKFNVLEMTCF